MKKCLKTRVNELVLSDLYEEAVEILMDSNDSALKKRSICFEILFADAVNRATEEFGGITIYTNEDRYKRAKMGMDDDVSQYVALYEDKCGEIHGLDDLIDSFIPEDNPMRVYYKELEKGAD